MTKLVYVPELDRGKRLDGTPFFGAYMWVPLAQIPNPTALLAAATVIEQNPHKGEGKTIKLAALIGDYLVISRHFYSIDGWLKRLKFFDEPVFNFETFEFQDNITIRESQLESWENLKEAESGILNLACGKGKTVLALKKVALRGWSTIVIVGTKGLIGQWRDEAIDKLNLDEDDIGIVQQDRLEWDRPFVIASIRTLMARHVPMRVRQRFGTVIFDEVHHLSAEMFSKCAPLFYGNRYGLTATIKREDGLEDIYKSHIGDVIYSDLVSDLPADIYFVKLSTKLVGNEPIYDKTGKLNIPRLRIYLGDLQERNKTIIEHVLRAISQGRKVLVLSHSKSQPEKLHSLFNKALGSQFKTTSAWMNGVKQSVKELTRTELLQNHEAVFSTFDIAREALDDQRLDTVLFVTPFKAWSGFQQGKGRIERSLKGKKTPLAIVFEDHLVGPAKSMLNELKVKIRLNGYTINTKEERVQGGFSKARNRRRIRPKKLK
jgi:superfamily II DNA or RNA helicase